MTTEKKKFELKIVTLPPEVTDAMIQEMERGYDRRHPPKPPEIGDKMVDGTIYAGISPDTNQPMYTAPADVPRRKGFDAAANYAKNLKVGGRKGFRVPSKAELNVLFQNREKGALKGTFNLTTGCYWSGTPCGNYDAYCQGFGGGYQARRYRGSLSSVRCVR